MTTFDKREQAFEKKFAQDEELRFKARARGSWLVGHWAAEKLGLVGADADAYARALMLANLDKAGSDYVFETINSDFEDKHIYLSGEQIRLTIDDFVKQALAELKAGVGGHFSN